MGKKRLKIAFFNIYNGVVNRGAETFVTELSNQLNKKNEVFVFQSGKKSNDNNYKVIKININIDLEKDSSVGSISRRFFLDYWSLKVLFFTLKLLPELFKRDFDVLIPLNGGWQTLILKIVSIFKNSKLICVGQSGIGWDDRINLLCFPDVFVAISEYAYNWAKSVNPFIKIVYIPNGVSTEVFNHKGKQLNISLKKPIVLCVAALTKSKRIDLVIKAVSKMKDASLLIVGSGELKEELLSLGSKLLGNRFLLISAKHNIMPSIYRCAQVFTMVPVPYESFGIVYLEALSSGLPVISPDDPIRREIIGSAGIYTNPNDSLQYAKDLKMALEKKWGDIPRKQALKYSWKNIARIYETIIYE